MKLTGVLNKKILIILILAIVITSLGLFFMYRYKQISNQTETSMQQSQELKKQIENMSPKENTSQTTFANNIKTYRNTEFGFEFQYPGDWKIIENPYGSPFSRFNLIIVPIKERYLPDPILINVVVPQFADNAFRDIQGTGVVVANISGKKYEYQEEGLFEISIVLPFKENKIILGVNKRYEDIFKQFLASFKFLK